MSNADHIESMLSAVREERAALRERDAKLQKREQTLQEWRREEARIPVQTDLLIGGGASTSRLASFLANTLADGKSFTAGKLGEMAVEHGLIEGDVSPGRVVHGALLSLARHKIAKKLDDGTWSRQ